MKRSDLICENGEISDGRTTVRRSRISGTQYRETVIQEGEAAGRYYTVFSGDGDMKSCLIEIISSVCPPGRTLVTGLGNENVCSDSLGPKALKYVPATAHLAVHEDFSALGMNEVYVHKADVTGKTGIESSAGIACIARLVRADRIIAIDSLACADKSRLCSTVQITDAGIAPGSGVGNNRKRLGADVCGVPVIAVGVPTVIDLESVCDSFGSGFMVTPRNIDELTDSFARIIGTAVSMALNPSLTEAEIMSLIM